MAQITDAKTSAITDTGAVAVAAGLQIKLRPKNFSWSDIRGFLSLRSDIFKHRTYFGRVSIATQLNHTSSQQISQENYGMFPLRLSAGTRYYLIWDTCRSKKIRIWCLTQIVYVSGCVCVCFRPTTMMMMENHTKLNSVTAHIYIVHLLPARLSDSSPGSDVDLFRVFLFLASTGKKSSNQFKSSSSKMWCFDKGVCRKQ